MQLGKIYKDKQSDALVKLTGIYFTVGLINDDVTHFIELSFKVLGLRHAYSTKRIRETTVPFTKENQKLVDAFVKDLLGPRFTPVE